MERLQRLTTADAPPDVLGLGPRGRPYSPAVHALVVIEGLDGSGKQTLTAALADRWRGRGRSVATMSFPRYGRDVHADLVRDALYGRLGDLATSVHGPAVLFALDRRAAVPELMDLLATHDVVLLDRYVTSNAAYGAARMGGPDAETGFPTWVQELEIGRFGLPVPDHQILLDTPVALAASRARGRAAGDDARSLDAFEADAELQARTAGMYRRLAAEGYLSPWTTVSPTPATPTSVTPAPVKPVPITPAPVPVPPATVTPTLGTLARVILELDERVLSRLDELVG